MEQIQIDNETISLKGIIVRYLHHWRLFIGVFLISLIPAILYLMYYPTTYEINSSVKIQDDSDMGSGGVSLGDASGLMKSFGLNGVSNGAINIDDEVATFKSHDLLREVVIRLGLNAKYIKPYSWQYRLYENLPFVMTADSSTLASQDETIEFYLHTDHSGTILVEGKTKYKTESYKYTSLPSVITFNNSSFVLSYGAGYKDGDEVKLYITMSPAGWVADDLSEEVKIDTYSDNSNILEYVYTDYEKQRGVDLLNTLVDVYNFRTDSIKDKEAYKTILFLDGRINKIISDLTNVEQTIEAYKIKNKMTDLEYDVQFYVDQMKDLQSKIVELESQMYAIKFMEAFVKNPANKYNLVPVLMNVQEGEKGGALTTYNEALLERQRLLQNSKETNPLLTTMDKQLNQMRESVFLTIQNAQESLNLTIVDLKSKEKLVFDKMGSVPTQEREFLEYKRQQEIFQGVYLILLQKREEAMLKMGKDMDRALVVDVAFAKSLPIGPRKLYAAIGLFLMTLLIPVGYLFCKEQFLSLKEEYIKTKKL